MAMVAHDKKMGAQFGAGLADHILGVTHNYMSFCFNIVFIADLQSPFQYPFCASLPVPFQQTDCLITENIRCNIYIINHLQSIAETPCAFGFQRHVCTPIHTPANSLHFRPPQQPQSPFPSPFSTAYCPLNSVLSILLLRS
eukprot:TRINITY_DN0_c0_g1_i2.p1 TRINITY_DN0_c0_g1~~TRINITY_DN0_c0_g1_i2.p1  ORF type:complete len:141 (+),score=3.58 TRINITY_DN0_c0_g1_i2:430-852(+)